MNKSIKLFAAIVAIFCLEGVSFAQETVLVNAAVEPVVEAVVQEQAVEPVAESVVEPVVEPAQEPAPVLAVTAPVMETSFSYGVVKIAAVDQITVTEYDFDKEEDVEVVYAINAETKFVNFSSIAELKEADEVDIEYRLEGDKRIAVSVSKEQEQQTQT